MADPERIYGYEVRKPFSSENTFFKSRKEVAGMAAEDGKIILNPYSLNTPEQQKLVARNEAARLHMRDTKYAPTFAVTPEQTASFAGTEYGKPGNEGFLRHTIVARILTGDPAAGKVTDEQKAAALEIQKALDKRR